VNHTDSAASSPRSGPAGSPLRRPLVVFLPLMIGGCLLDLLTKRLMFDWLKLPSDPQSEIHWVVQDFFGFQTAVNQGALFGIGQGMTVLFVTISLFAIAVIIGWIIKGSQQTMLLTISLGLISAGILGNLYDRLGCWHIGVEIQETLKYGVRDWILFDFGFYKWPNFNLADSYLVCGAGILVWEAFQIPADSGTKNRDK
jgi:signal peptidase II